MLRIDARGQGIGIGVEGQPPLAQESDPERDEEDAADPARGQSLVPAPDHHLRHAGHIGRRGSPDEPHQHPLLQGDSGQDQKCQGSEKRSDGDFPVGTHVTHVNNHA